MIGNIHLRCTFINDHRHFYRQSLFITCIQNRNIYMQCSHSVRHKSRMYHCIHQILLQIFSLCTNFNSAIKHKLCINNNRILSVCYDIIHMNICHSKYISKTAFRTTPIIIFLNFLCTHTFVFSYFLFPTIIIPRRHQMP